MHAGLEFSKPVVVDEGVAFRVSLTEGRRRVSVIAIATRARLGTGEEAQGLALLAAFARASAELFAEAVRHVRANDADSPVYLGRRSGAGPA